MVLDESSGSMTTTPISSSEEGYGLQNSIAGYYEFNSEGMLTTNTFKGVIAFAEDKNNEKGYWVDDDGNLLSKYGTSYPANVFDSNSLLYEPLENYKNYLRSTLGKTSVATKLITREGLISLGCNNSCTSAPSWVYSTNYRTASAYDNYYVWNVYSNGGTDGNPFDIPALGLRPVITISKSEL